VQNPLFFRENTKMFFGDASACVSELLRAIADEPADTHAMA